MQIGDKAVDFSLYSDKKKLFQLSQVTKEGPVLLLFFPAAFTGTCTTELNEVNNTLEEYGGATVVGISTDTPFTLAEYGKVNALRFDLLSDHDAEVSALYQTKYDEGFTGMKLVRISKRSAFVIDREGVIQYIEVLENPGRIPDLEAIKNVLKSIS